MENIFKQFYFIGGVLLTILLAEIAPWIGCRGGIFKSPLFPEFTVKYLAVSLIFYISGVTLKTQEFFQAFKIWKVHIFIQLFSFIFTPLLIQLICFLLVKPFHLNEWLIKGLVTVGCMPPPVSSAVIFTRSVKGNVAVAIFNAALGSFTGIILTPLLLLFHVGLTTTLPAMPTIVQLTQTVIFPLLLGQLSQVAINSKVWAQLPLSIMSQVSLLYIIYTSFCDMFMQDDFIVEAHLILVTILLVLLLQIFLICCCFLFSSLLGHHKFGFSPEETVAIVFCSFQKSLSLGMPLLKTLYGGYSHLSQISLPLIIYHAIQLILGGLLVPPTRHWIEKQSRPCRSHTVP